MHAHRTHTLPTYETTADTALQPEKWNWKKNRKEEKLHKNIVGYDKSFADEKVQPNENWKLFSWKIIAGANFPNSE